MNFFNRNRCNNCCNVSFCGCRCGFCLFPTPFWTNDCCGNNILVTTIAPAGASASVTVPNIIL